MCTTGQVLFERLFTKANCNSSALTKEKSQQSDFCQVSGFVYKTSAKHPFFFVSTNVADYMLTYPFSVQSLYVIQSIMTCVLFGHPGLPGKRINSGNYFLIENPLICCCSPDTNPSMHTQTRRPVRFVFERGQEHQGIF